MNLIPTTEEIAEQVRRLRASIREKDEIEKNPELKKIRDTEAALYNKKVADVLRMERKHIEDQFK